MKGSHRTALLFLLPSFIFVVFFSLFPIFESFRLSFYRLILTLPWIGQKPIGWQNYIDLWDDPVAMESLFTTLIFVGVTIPLELLCGLGIALVLNEAFHGRGLLRAVVLIPWAIPTVVSARMWGWMFNDVYGVVNEILLALGVVEEGLAWTADPDLALAAVVAVDVWKTAPFMTLLILAALQTLPEDVYEAAQIDGARPVRVFLQITLPMIRGPLLVAVIFRMLDALRVFDVFYVLTSNSVDTTPMAGYARQKMFEHQQMGAGAAAASVLFALIAVFTAVYMVAARVKVEPEAA